MLGEPDIESWELFDVSNSERKGAVGVDMCRHVSCILVT